MLEKLFARKQAEQLVESVKNLDAETVSDGLHTVAKRAQEYAGQAQEWAAPRLEQAWKETVKATAPRIEAASEAVRPKIDAAAEKITGDYLPRLQRAMHDASAAAQSGGSLSDRADKVYNATAKALTEPTKKGHPVLKALGLTALAAALSAAGYILWRRSQPVEDPWAEEYWADLDQKTKEVDFAQQAEEAENRAEEAVANMELKDPKEAMKEVAKAAKKAAAKAEDKAEELAESANDALDKAKDKAEDVAEDIKDAVTEN